MPVKTGAGNGDAEEARENDGFAEFAVRDADAEDAAAEDEVVDCAIHRIEFSSFIEWDKSVLAGVEFHNSFL